MENIFLLTINNHHIRNKLKLRGYKQYEIFNEKHPFTVVDKESHYYFSTTSTDPSLKNICQKRYTDEKVFFLMLDSK